MGINSGSTGKKVLVFIDSTIDHKQYLHILQDNLVTFGRNECLGSSWIFEESNDSKYTITHTQLQYVKEWDPYIYLKQQPSPH